MVQCTNMGESAQAEDLSYDPTADTATVLAEILERLSDGDQEITPIS